MRTFRPGCVRASPHRGATLLAVAGLCGVLAASAIAQEPAAAPDNGAPSAADPSQDVVTDGDGSVNRAPEPVGPLKVLSWNVASSPYAVAMRKIKSAVPSWRTSFGSERRTIEVPTAPQAADIDADIVLLQGITTPRAIRRLFPARKWRLIFSRRALDSLPKGSVFTAPVSSVEIEAVAVRFRQGLRIVGRAEDVDTGSTAQAVTVSQEVAGASASASAGLAIKVLDRGKPLWLASISVGAVCNVPEPCDRVGVLQRWHAARATSGEATIAGGWMPAGGETAPCDKQAIEVDALALEVPRPLGKGENRPLFGCVAELTLP